MGRGCEPASNAARLRVSFRMNRDAVAFAIKHDGAEAVGSDGMRVLDHGAAVGHDLTYGIANAAVCVEVEEHPARGDFGFVEHKTAAVAVLVFDHAKREVAIGFFIDADA